MQFYHSSYNRSGCNLVLLILKTFSGHNKFPSLLSVWLILSASFSANDNDNLVAAVGRGGGRKAKSLYSTSEPITQLDIHNFNSTVYGKPRAFFIEFYSSWCGGCIAYAPTFKKIAANLAPWAKVLEVGALNCADEINTRICREHEIDGYPTLKFFKYNSQSAGDAEEYEADRMNFTKVAGNLAAMVYKDWQRVHPPNWPPFRPLDDPQKSLDDSFWSTDFPKAEWVVMSVNQYAKPDADLLTPMMGSVLMDWSSVPTIGVTMARHDHPAVIGAKLPATPGLLILKKRTNGFYWVSKTKMTTRDGINEKIAEITGLTIPKNARSQGGSDTDIELVQVATTAAAMKVTPPPGVNRWSVNMEDMLSGLGYIFRHEISMKKTISGEKLKALKAFMAVLSKYFPGMPPVRRLLYRLSTWLNEQTDSITAEMWDKEFNTQQEDLGRPLPLNTTWVACLGSSPQYRGYTCSLWTILHSLTVSAYRKDHKDPSFVAYTDVIQPIIEYIQHFFGCRECVEHFMEGAKDAVFVVTEPADVVLWLWKMHNRPNKFLAPVKGSTDPAFPKVQFPPEDLCPECRDDETKRGGIEWDTDAVLEFLLKFYYDDIIIGTKKLGTYSDYKLISFAGGPQSAAADKTKPPPSPPPPIIQDKHLNINPKFRHLGENVDEEERKQQQRVKAQRLADERSMAVDGVRLDDARLENSVSLFGFDVTFSTAYKLLGIAALILAYYWYKRRSRGGRGGSLFGGRTVAPRKA